MEDRYLIIPICGHQYYKKKLSKLYQEQVANNLGWVFKTPTGLEVVNIIDQKCWKWSQHSFYI